MIVLHNMGRSAGPNICTERLQVPKVNRKRVVRDLIACFKQSVYLRIKAIFHRTKADGWTRNTTSIASMFKALSS
jgi:hypothetical protein